MFRGGKMYVENNCLRCKKTVYPTDKIGPLKDFSFFHGGCLSLRGMFKQTDPPHLLQQPALSGRQGGLLQPARPQNRTGPLRLRVHGHQAGHAGPQVRSDRQRADQARRKSHFRRWRSGPSGLRWRNPDKATEETSMGRIRRTERSKVVIPMPTNGVDSIPVPSTSNTL